MSIGRHLPSRTITPSGRRRPQPVRWVDLAVHYYVGARAAAFWNHRPNAEIQAHHAVELALKWALVRPIGGPHPWPGRTQARTVQDMKKAKHSLMRLWAMLNDDYPGHRLGHLSRYVLHLDRVELLMQRYAEMPDNGAITYIATLEETTGVSGAESYAIDLPRLDALFHGLLHLTDTDPLVVRASVAPQWPNEWSAEKYYRRDNAAALSW